MTDEPTTPMDEIEYRPQNVRDTLVDLKDTAELAVDLAYAAALYGHDGLAEVVHELEARADSLQYPAKISLMLAAKRAQDAERLVGVIQIVDAAVQITNAAADIAAIVLDDVGLPNEIRAGLPEADEALVRATITDSSPLVDRSLADLQFETETGVDVLAIRRAGNWRIAPDPDTILQADDVLVGSGPHEGVSDIYERATGTNWERTLPDEPAVPEVARAVETVIDLKNIAELAIGLGYGAVLLDDEDLAEAVQDLEEASDARQDDIETWVIEAGEHVADPTKLRGLLHLADASETICDAALDIADITLREGEVHPLVGHAVRDSEEHLTTVTVTPGSTMDGETLEDLEIEEHTGVALMAIHRRDEWKLDPEPDLEIHADDVLFVRGPREGIDILRSWAGQEPAGTTS